MFVKVGTTDLHPFPWFMDTVGRDYWLYKEMHASAAGQGSGWLTHCTYVSCYDRVP